MILTEQPNNRDTLHAVIEQDERTAYFYLYPAESFSDRYSIRTCWLRNLQQAPASKDIAAMEGGIAPLLEAEACNHPEGLAPLETDLLTIVWTEEDDGAAVMYDGVPLGIIPGWTLSSDTPVAFAADCISEDENSFIQPIRQDQADQVFRAVEFWEKWSSEAVNPWQHMQEQFIAAYETSFGTMQKYYAIDGQQWPPMALAQFEKDNIIYFLSLGASIRPMPWVEVLYQEKATGFRRIELGLAISKADYSGDEIMQMAQALSGFADTPWKTLSWLGEGHTISSAGAPDGYESFILSAALYNGSNIPLPEIEGDVVNLLWAIPVTKQEREYAHSLPNGGYDLLEKLIQEGVTHIIQQRKTVI